MDGRAFLATARYLLASPCEENRRTAAGRASYALIHEGLAALERWGFPMPPGETVHRFLRQRVSFASNPDLRQVDNALDETSRLRNHADYRLRTSQRFATDWDGLQAMNFSQTAIDLLDQIEADPARRSAAIAALRAAFP